MKNHCSHSKMQQGRSLKDQKTHLLDMIEDLSPKVEASASKTGVTAMTTNVRPRSPPYSQETIPAIKDHIKRSEIAIKNLKEHTAKKMCPSTLRYNIRS